MAELTNLETKLGRGPRAGDGRPARSDTGRSWGRSTSVPACGR